MKTSRTCGQLSQRILLSALLLGVGLFAGPTAKAEPCATPDSPIALHDLAWLEGSWHGTDGEKSWEEHWSAPEAGGIVGMFRMYEGEALITYELVLIEQIEGRLVYHLRHFGREMEAWEDGPLTFGLAESSRESILFKANKEQAGPTYIRYTRTGENSMDVWVGGTPEPSEEGFTLPIKRKE